MVEIYFPEGCLYYECTDWLEERFDEMWQIVAWIQREEPDRNMFILRKMKL